MAGRSSRSRDDDDARASVLAALLEPHLDTLSEAARIREAAEREQAERAAAAIRAVRRKLDEAELMALIFEHLDPDNPRVCEGIEFDRLVVLSEPEPLPEPGPHELADSPSVQSNPHIDHLNHIDHIDASAWIGQSWADDIRPIPAELLDRPELDEQQHGLLVRAARRELASLNLRRLASAEALVHLEVFVRLCRAERVRYCRVIPGKGVDSKAEPVIKRLVIEWCRAGAAVLGWAPELDRHGEWGAMILELRAPTRV
jgi:DNA-nicking Smr family endonuclease